MLAKLPTDKEYVEYREEEIQKFCDEIHGLFPDQDLTKLRSASVIFANKAENRWVWSYR